MAFGDLLGTLSGSLGSITNPTDATGSVAVSVGDLIFVSYGERTALTASGVTDNLGNTYTAQDIGKDGGSAAGRAFYSIVTTGGTLTTVHVAATASSDDVAIAVACFAGPYAVSPVDKSPATTTGDITSPYDCPSTGTLSQADELVLGWISVTNGRDATSTSPSTLAVSVKSGTEGGANTASTAINYRVVAATTAVAPQFTFAGGSINSSVLGTISFAKGSIAPQNLTPSLFSDGDTFYTPVVTARKNLTPSLFSNSSVFPSARVSTRVFQPNIFQHNIFQVAAGSRTLTPGLYSNSQAFFSPTVSATYSLTPGLFTDSDTFFTPTVNATYGLTPSLFSDGDTFYSPTVGASYNLQPGLYSDADTFYSPTVHTTYAVTATLVTNAQTFYSPTVGSTYSLSPALFTNTQSFYSPTIIQQQFLTPSLYTNAQVFFTPVVHSSYGLSPSKVSNAQTFYSPSVTTIKNLRPSLVVNGTTFHSPTVSGSGIQAHSNDIVIFRRRRRR